MPSMSNPDLKAGFLKAFRARSEPSIPSAASPVQKGVTRDRAVVAAVVIVVLVIGGTAYVVVTDSASAARPSNLFANGDSRRATSH